VRYRLDNGVGTEHTGDVAVISVWRIDTKLCPIAAFRELVTIEHGRPLKVESFQYRLTLGLYNIHRQTHGVPKTRNASFGWRNISAFSYTMLVTLLIVTQNYVEKCATLDYRILQTLNSAG
jgi:hypothetical protein